MNPVGQAPEPFMSFRVYCSPSYNAKRAGAVGSQSRERALDSGRIFTGLLGGLYELIQPFNKYVKSTCYIPGNILCFGDTTMSKNRHIVAIVELTVLWEEESKQINNPAS